MRNQLMKMFERGQLVDMMYIAKTGEISKRRIKITKVSDASFSAYCITKHANRSFIIDNILALSPVIRKEREVI